MKSVVAAVDFSQVTERVVAEAERYARAFGCPLYLVHVEAPEPEFVGYDPGPQNVRNAVAEDMKGHHAQLHALRDRLRAGGLEAHALLIQGYTGPKIVAEGRRLEAELIVVGSHGHGALMHLLLGSVSEAVMKDAPCPVLVVPSPREKT